MGATMDGTMGKHMKAGGGYPRPLQEAVVRANTARFCAAMGARSLLGALNRLQDGRAQLPGQWGQGHGGRVNVEDRGGAEDEQGQQGSHVCALEVGAGGSSRLFLFFNAG